MNVMEGNVFINYLKILKFLIVLVFNIYNLFKIVINKLDYYNYDM